jgi:hypothetical protein
VDEPTLVRMVRVELEEHAWQDYLTAAFNIGDNTMTVADPVKWAQGDIAEPDDDTGELVLVKADGVAATPVSVRRGWNGTSPANHASNAPVRKGVRWSYQQIAAAITKEIYRLWPSAWIEGGPTTITPATGVRWYALPAGAMDLISVHQVRSGTSLDFYEYGDGRAPPVIFEARHPTLGVPAIGFPAGFATMATTVKVCWRDKVTVATDVEEGLMAEVVVMGACARLLAGEESERVGEDTSISDDAPAGSRLRSGAWFEQQRKDKLFELNLQLLRDRPPVGVWRG